MMKTVTIKASEIKRERHVIDASGQTLGRLATRVAILLMGKHKPNYAPNLDCGDLVVITNAGKVRVPSSKQAKQKVYYWHSNYPGGFKSITLERLMETHPTRALEWAVKGMLPHTRLGGHMLKKLRVYAGDVVAPAPKKTKSRAKKAAVKEGEASKEGASPDKK